jgi:DNA primase
LIKEQNMDVIIWAIILGAVFYINKKSKSAGSKNTQPNKPRPQQKQMQQIWNSMQNTVQSGMNALNQTYQQRPQPQMQQRAQQSQRPQMQQRAQQPQRPQMQQRVQPQQRPQQSNPDIVQRAVKNNARFADDTTQKELEAMHGHSEAQQKLAQEHSRNCQTLHTKAADGAKIIEAETQSMFGSVEDLIAMGYSGNLEFERDFLGEGLDMINNF